MKTVLYALLFSLVSCTSIKPGCMVQDKFSAIATDVVVSKLQCANPFAVKLDMDGLVKNLGLCKDQKTGQMADAICPFAVPAVVDKIAGTAIPAAWQCSAQNAKATLSTSLMSACKSLPVNQWTPAAEE